MTCVLIGGSGTLGQRLMTRLVDQDEDVVCFSRGEHAQKALKDRFPSVRFVIGDVRDAAAVKNVVGNALTVFLLAAIKHVDVAEENPLEAIKTNIHGAVNVAEACLAGKVDYCVYSNTDKAVLPITSYGYTKALAQNYLLGLNRFGETSFSAFNWGNVIASQGSVIPQFVRALKAGEPIRITDPRMSRFWLKAETAADFMLEQYSRASKTRAMIPPVKAATLLRVIESLARLTGISSYNVETIGLRGTEKIHEVLESTHEHCLRSDTCDQYTDEELDNLLRPYA